MNIKTTVCQNVRFLFINGYKALKLIVIYSGLAFIANKFRFQKNESKYPNGMVWAFGIYFTVYTLSLTLYQNRIDKIENRISFLVNYAGSNNFRIFFKEYESIRQAKVPLQPVLWKPLTTIRSLTGKRIDYSENENLLEGLLEEVKLKTTNSDLRSMNFNNLYLVSSNFEGSVLQLSGFENSNLSLSRFGSTNISSTSFRGSVLTGGIFHHANCANASFDSTYVRGVEFNGANLTMASFKNAYCRYSVFLNARLQGVKFQDADLSLVDFRGANGLSAEQLRIAKSLAGARFDDDLLLRIKRFHPELKKRIDSIPEETMTTSVFFKEVN